MNVFTTKKGTELPILNLRGKDYLEVKYRLVWFREERPQWGIETEVAARTEKSACMRATIKDESGRVVAMAHKTEDSQGFGDFLEKAETGAIGRALALIGYGTQFCADELDEGARIVDAPVGRPNPHAAKNFQPAHDEGDPTKKWPATMPYGKYPKKTIDQIMREGGPKAVEECLDKIEEKVKLEMRQPTDQENELRASAEVLLREFETKHNEITNGLTVGKPDMGEFKITFGKKYLGKKIKDINQDEMLGYIKWLKDDADKKGKALSPEVALLVRAVDRYYHPEDRAGNGYREDME